MLPVFLIPETTIREAGSGLAFSLGEYCGGALTLTLGITRIVEQEGLDLTIWGSADGIEWSNKALIAFPQKFYCGTYQIRLDLADRAEIKYLQARWQANRWAKGDAKPLFTIYLFAEILQPAIMAMGA
jgi:hypothetical protein